MSRPIVRKIYCYALGLLLPFTSIDANPWELGFRYGQGFRVPGRFDSNLNGFSSSFDPTVLSDVTVSGGKGTATYEALLRYSIDSESKISFVLGRQDLSTLTINELTTDRFATQLKNDIFSYHLLVMYHFVYRLPRGMEWENGLGLGFVSADWQIRGYSGGGNSSTSLFNQRGNLRGSGLGYRLETAINLPLVDNNYFQIGIGYHHIAIPNFSGNYNGETSSFYLGSEGRVGVFDNTRVLDANVSTDQFLRRLDLSSGSWNLYFSVLHRFLD
ncbi:LIC_11366 family protein [Leptospira ryugenii]|uniref:LIC_11366 family protein n=1 Tax=Leptospira ryugenii TaxID=1917863 RepID=UPI000D59482C|nr:hypothetical protein [Leptospira ryugenii]